MAQTRKTSLLIALFVAGLAAPFGAHAAPTAQDAELSPQEAEALARIAGEMETVIFEVCLPVVRGADVADTPGYEALGRPPLVDGSFKTSTGITVTPVLDDRAGCSFYPEQSWEKEIFSVLLPLENQDQSREAGDLNPVPIRVGEAYHQFITRDARVGITINRNYAGGRVFAYASTPQEVARHYAAAWAAEFNPPGDAALLAFEACSSFMSLVSRDDRDDTPLVDVAFNGRFGNTGARLRGNIDASIYPGREGCEVFVQGAELTGVIADALARPDSGWSRVTETSWTRADGGRVELKADGETLDYLVHPGDFAQHDWPAGVWNWRDEDSETAETPAGS